QRVHAALTITVGAGRAVRPVDSKTRRRGIRPGMSRHIEARFAIASWDETSFEDGDDATKLTEALVAKRYDGDIKGTSTTKWLRAHGPAKRALFVGVDHISGTHSGKKGRVVLLHGGEYCDGLATAELRVASGTDELANVA